MSILLFLCASSALALTIPETEHSRVANHPLSIRGEHAVSVAATNATTIKKPAKFNTTFTWPNASLPSWLATYDFSKQRKGTKLCNLFQDCGEISGDSDGSDDEDDANGNSTAVSAPSNSTKRSWRRSLFKRGNARKFGQSRNSDGEDEEEEHEGVPMTSNPYPDLYEFGEGDDLDVYEQGNEWGTLDHSNQLETTQGMVVEHRLEEQTPYHYAQDKVKGKQKQDNFEDALQAPLTSKGKQKMAEKFPWGKEFTQKHPDATLEQAAFETLGGKQNRKFAALPDEHNNAKAKGWKNQKPIAESRMKAMRSNVAAGTWDPQVFSDVGRILPETRNYIQDSASYIQQDAADFSEVLDGAGHDLTDVPFRDEYDEEYYPGGEFEDYVGETIRHVSDQFTSTGSQYYTGAVNTLRSVVDTTRAAAQQMEQEQDPDFYENEEDMKAAAEKWEKKGKKLNKAFDSANDVMHKAYDDYLAAEARANSVEKKFLNKNLRKSEQDAIKRKYKWGDVKKQKESLEKRYLRKLEDFNKASHSLKMHSAEGANQEAERVEGSLRDLEAVQGQFDDLALDPNDFVPDRHTNCKRDGSCGLDKSKGKQGPAEKEKSQEGPKPQEQQEPGTARPETQEELETEKPAGQEPDTGLPETHDPSLGVPKLPAPKVAAAGRM